MKDCIEWSKSRNKAGYGRVWRDGKICRAHRLVFLDCNGYLPEVVRHSCDNPGCVNPVHLLGGTYQDNVDDRQARDRQARGERNRPSKLLEDQVHWIRASSLPQRVVADWLGVTRKSVRNVRRRKTWKHI